MLDRVASIKSTTEVDRHVGARLRKARMALGLSQEKLADALGLTFQQVQKYEKGQNRIGASRLYQICQVLKTEPSRFFDGLGDPVSISDEASSSGIEIYRRGYAEGVRDARAAAVKAIGALVVEND